MMSNEDFQKAKGIAAADDFEFHFSAEQLTKALRDLADRIESGTETPVKGIFTVSTDKPGETYYQFFTKK